LYDIHIELDHVPFLEPFPEDEHLMLQIEDVMTTQQVPPPLPRINPPCAALSSAMTL